MDKLIIKKDPSLKVTGYSCKLNGVEIPNKKKVTVIKKEGYLPVIIIEVVAPYGGFGVELIEDESC